MGRKVDVLAAPWCQKSETSRCSRSVLRCRETALVQLLRGGLPRRGAGGGAEQSSAAHLHSSCRGNFLERLQVDQRSHQRWQEILHLVESARCACSGDPATAASDATRWTPGSCPAPRCRSDLRIRRGPAIPTGADGQPSNRRPIGGSPRRVHPTHPHGTCCRYCYRRWPTGCWHCHVLRHVITGTTSSVRYVGYFTLFEMDTRSGNMPE
jgi:hypothetical protein